MNDRGPKNPDSLVVALDGDKLGQIGGMAMAIVVMALCFYWRETDGATALVRTGWAFTAGYGCTFLLVRVILRTTLFEMLQNERAKKPKGLKHTDKLRARAGDETLVESDLDDLGLQSLASRPKS